MNDTGDHENIYDSQFSYTEVHEMNGTLYGDCERKAVHIRERNSQNPWYASENPMIFSNLTTNITISEEDLKDLKAKNSIRYTRLVNSQYG